MFIIATLNFDQYDAASASASAAADHSAAIATAATVAPVVGQHLTSLLDALVSALAGGLPVRYTREVATLLRRLRRLDAGATQQALVGVLQARLPNLAPAAKTAFAEAFASESVDLSSACDEFAGACRRRKRWIH